MKVICIGGGAASFFFAANLAKQGRGHQITILEQGRQVLGKVAISGGGRCNVTHHCFDPAVLVEHYPRGARELLGPFHQFGPSDTVEWFESRGVNLKTEADGRMFPVANKSSAIINCLTEACTRAGVETRLGCKVKKITPAGDRRYHVFTMAGESMSADVLFIGSGSSKQIWQQLGHLGHTIIDPIPSLFTFSIRDPRLQGLSGISIPDVEISAMGTSASGPLLITHKGLSGPAILRLSAFKAREMHGADYRFEVSIDLLPETSAQDLRSLRDTQGKKLLGNHSLTGLPKRLHKSILDHAGLEPTKKYASLSNKELELWTASLKRAVFEVVGQNRFKDEFVTAGGVDLAEVDMSTFSSKILPGIYMAGEVLNIDGVTGGFNFQAAWTGAFLAARSAAHLLI